MNTDDFNQIFVLVSVAVILFTVSAFFAFLYWSKRDRQKRDAALRFYNHKFHPENRDSAED
jgi:hypothetical protein